MNNIDTFKNKYPTQTLDILGRPFPFRYHKNEQSDITLVFLVGGLGMSDLLAFQFEEFAKEYSVITFDYSPNYPNLQTLTDAIAELMRKLRVRAYFAGQSLGGFIAQIMAKKYPEVVEGLILSNTGTLSSELDEEGTQCFYDMLNRIDKSLLIIKLMPFSLMKRFIGKAVRKKIGGQLSEQEKEVLGDFIHEMEKNLTKKYELHMTLLLKDLQNHWNLERADFVQFKGKVLLVLSDDDTTFNDSIKRTLISIMPDPIVVTDILGGHLAILFKFDRFKQVLTDFIDGSPTG